MWAARPHNYNPNLTNHSFLPSPLSPHPHLPIHQQIMLLDPQKIPPFPLALRHHPHPNHHPASLDPASLTPPLTLVTHWALGTGSARTSREGPGIVEGSRASWDRFASTWIGAASKAGQVLPVQSFTSDIGRKQACVKQGPLWCAFCYENVCALVSL